MEQPSISKVYVFAARYPFDAVSGYVPAERKAEIDGCTDGKTRAEMYYAFKLLEIALLKSYGVDMRDCNFHRSANGKWTCNVCDLSLTHCGNVVAAAVSGASVGIDVEKRDDARFDKRLQRRIFSEKENERAQYMTDAERCIYTNRLWTVKEAAFKCKGTGFFIPSGIDTTETASKTSLLLDGEEEYYLTVVCKNNSELCYNTIAVQLKNLD